MMAEIAAIPSPATPTSSTSPPTNDNISPPVTTIPCFVCGDRSSGRHYGVLTCDGCRGFFKRSVRRGLGYLCREKGQCVVDLSRRNQCQSCRLKKCLRVGMKREAVQHERAPRNKKDGTVRNEFSPYPPQIIYHPIPMPGEVDMPVPVAAFPVERSAVAVPPPPSPLPKPNIFVTSPTELYEVCARILYEAISWARNVPTFSTLPLDDQALLLEYSWSEIFLLSLAQLNIPLGMESMIKLARMNKDFQGKDGKRQEIDKETVNELVHIQSVVYKFKTLNLTSTEYGCVKAIVLFKPDLRRIQSRQHIESLQEQAQLRLLDSVMAKGPRSRFGTILLKLSLLGEVSPSFIEKCFFKGGLENISEDFNNKLSSNNPSLDDERYDSNDQSKLDSPSSDQSEDRLQQKEPSEEEPKEQCEEDPKLLLEHEIKKEVEEIVTIEITPSSS